MNGRAATNANPWPPMARVRDILNAYDDAEEGERFVRADDQRDD